MSVWQRWRACNRTIRPLRVFGGGALFLAALPGGLLWAQSVADEKVVRQVLVDREVAWNSRDASAWVKDFAADSRFINILGMRFPDRASNEQRHAALFATIFRNSTLTVELQEMRFADPDTAIVEARLQLTGYEALPPGIGESAPGPWRLAWSMYCNGSMVNGSSSSARIPRLLQSHPVNGHVDTSYGDCLGTHRFHHPRLA